MNAMMAIIYRVYRQRITNIGFLFWDVFVPVAYLTLFGLGFAESVASSFTIEGEQVDYLAFLLPGVIAMTGFSVAMNSSWGFFMDKDSGVFYELLTYPVMRRTLLIGQICFNILLSGVGSFLAILVAVLWMKVQIHWTLLPLTIAAIVITTAGWYFLMSIFAIRLRRMDAFNTATSVAYIFLMFMSTLFYPIQDLPAWFRWVAWVNPMTWQVDLLRYSLLGMGQEWIVGLEAVAFVLFTVVCLAFAVRELNRAS